MKALVILFLIVAIFGGAYFATYQLYLKPQQALAQEKARGPAPLPPDPTLPEFQKRLAEQDSQSLPEARALWTDFIEHFPESSKIDEAKDILGKLNVAIFFSNIPTPEKEVYTVNKGDVITRVAQKLKTTPEMLMRVNNMRSDMLRIGQKIVTTPNDFTLSISRHRQRVTLLNSGKFFKQYHILKMPVPKGSAKGPAPANGKVAATPRPPKVTGKVVDHIAWFNGLRITYTDKSFAFADHWVTIAPGGHSLYCEHSADAGTPPPIDHPAGGGYTLSPEDLRELSSLLKKNDLVTID